MEKIKNFVKQMLGKENIISPICDQYNYTANKDSFAGNSMAQEHVLLVTNYFLSSMELIVLQKRLSIEGCKYSIFHCEYTAITMEQINKMLGSKRQIFNHIINVFDMNFISSFKLDDPVKFVYQTLQKEMEYLIQGNIKGTLCTAIIQGTDQIVSETLRTLIHGLGKVVGEHGIIENGVIGSEEIPMEDLAATVIYLSSKYGQILSGEVLKMNF